MNIFNFVFNSCSNIATYYKSLYKYFSIREGSNMSNCILITNISLWNTYAYLYIISNVLNANINTIKFNQIVRKVRLQLFQKQIAS